MTRSKWLTSAGALILLAATLWLAMRKPSVPPAAAPEAGVAPATPAAPAPGPSPQLAAGIRRVQELYETESRRVGQVDADPAATEARLRTAARELSAEEIGWLAGQALDAQTEADARFFATYLVALSGQAAAVPSLSRIALAPLPPSKNETKRAEERMIRAQAVEGISRACQAAGAREALLDVVEKQADEFLRDRAHRGLYACATGKPIEEQDKEALRKLRGGAPKGESSR